MNRSARLSLATIFLLAVLITALKVSVASSQGPTLVVAYVPGELPVNDPDSALWAETVPLEVPLSAQVVTTPKIETNVKSITARALHNRNEIAILVEWSDPTKNESMIRPQDFRDAVAVQFSLSATAPFYCMGQIGSEVNIWHWKADWQADMAGRQDMETAYPNMYVDSYPFADPEVGLRTGPGNYQDINYLPALKAGNLFAVAEHVSSVEDLSANGFGGLKAQPLSGQNVQGHGVWVNGKWRVIFSRAAYSQDTNDARFFPKALYSVAFAAWDGANGERNGQKSTSQWLAMRLDAVPSTEAPSLAAKAQPPVDSATPILTLTIFPLVCISAPLLVGLLLVAAIAQMEKEA